MVGFTYRRVPAVQLARQLVAAGELGEIREARAVYLQDWLSDPEAPMTWRLDRSAAGSGALGDLGAHIVDMVQFLTGEPITRVAGTTRTFTTERPLLTENVGLSGSRVVDRAWSGDRRRRRHVPRARSAAAGWRRSRPPGSHPDARTASRWS